jgi:hypothetical protein
MNKTRIMWAALWLAAPFACFPQTEPDTISSIMLDEIVIAARPVITLPDGSSYIPSAEKKRSALSGIDLLHKMQLPRIAVNQMTGAVYLPGGGEVRLCINGMEVTSAEIAALRPADVIRIDYHDNRGARYSGADAVIDYITRRHDSGGNLSAESMDMLGDGKWAYIQNLSGQYCHGPSSLSLTGSLFSMHRDNWVRDYEERWLYPTGPVTRTETGLPVSVGLTGVQGALTYSLCNEPVGVLNIRASFGGNYIPAKEEGDRHTWLHISGSDKGVEVTEHTRERESAPSLGVFYRRALGHGTLTASIDGSLLFSRSHHSYSETPEDGVSVTTLSEARGRKFSIGGEAYYELAAGPGQFTAGGRCRQGHTFNRYTGSVSGDVTLDQNQTSVFGEYNVRTGRWDFMGNLTLSHLHSSQSGVTYDRFSILPSLGIGWNPLEALRLRYDFKMTREHPSVAALSNVEQPIQPGLVRRGNPCLKSFPVIRQRLNLSWTHGIFSADAMVDYRHEINPVMPSVFAENGGFVTTFENQRSFRELRGELSIGLRLWGDHLSISVMPWMSRYYSHGNSYRHVRDICHIGGSMDFVWGNWIANACVMTGAATSMYGEEIINEKDMNSILVGYKTDS